MVVQINNTSPSRFVTENAQEDERIENLKQRVTVQYDTPLDGGALFAGRYRKIDEIGGGGMGVVYLMEDTMLDNQRFAVKMLHPYLADNEEALRLIAREAKNAQKLHHNHIVCVRHYAKYNRTPYIVMDYIAGKTLREQLGNGPVPEKTVIALLKPIADALDYAHRPTPNRSAVLHRDIKPDNIIFQRFDNDVLYPVILDFGISKAAKDIAVMTNFRRTPGYTPPEKMQDASCASSVAHDIFSFAVTAYECLTGKLPFGKEEDAATLERIRNADFERIDSDSAFARAVERGLSFLPEDRPKTCSEFFAEPETPVKVDRERQEYSVSGVENAQPPPTTEPEMSSTIEPKPATESQPPPATEPITWTTETMPPPPHVPEWIPKSAILTAACQDYRVMLAESAILHGGESCVAEGLRNIQALLRDAFSADERGVDLVLLLFLFNQVSMIRRRFAATHGDDRFFMEHRRRNVEFRMEGIEGQPWIAAMKKSIEI